MLFMPISSLILCFQISNQGGLTDFQDNEEYKHGSFSHPDVNTEVSTSLESDLIYKIESMPFSHQMLKLRYLLL